jgi:hypothetical protein
MQRARIRNEVAMRHHRAFRPAGGARGVDQAGEVVRRAHRSREGGRLFIGTPQLQAVPHTLEPVASFRAAESDARFGVGHEMRDLARLVGRVERQVHHPRAQAAEIEEHGLLGLLDLRGDAVAGLQPERNQQVGIARRLGFEVGVRVAPAARDLEAHGLGLPGERARQDGVEVLAHAERKTGQQKSRAMRGFGADRPFSCPPWPRRP